ncbi:MAG: hypothetical protein HC842_04885 [Cytophagales bacterium]|nr:hypothetical protein [Cytophagales bacterium]
MQLLYSKQVTVDGITIRNKTEVHGPSTDGVDIDSSEDILVQNCDIACMDDNFCIKSGRDADGHRVNRPSHHIVLRNNKTSAGAGLLVFGSEVSGGIHHVYATNMHADVTTRGIRVKSARTRGGVIENILIEDISIQNTPFSFEFTLDWNPAYSYTSLPQGYDPQEIPKHWKTLLLPVAPADGITTLRHVTFRKVSVSGKSWKAFNVQGHAEAPVAQFLFDDCDIRTQTAGSIENATNWESKGSSFQFTDGKPLLQISCQRMEGF